MNTLNAQEKNNRQIAYWLLIGVGMIVIQVLLGGITRLTESGLSITEWKPITGALPPLSDQAWQIEFEKYRHTDQFKYVHQYFSLREFKFIFFWEWFHRLWARLMGMVFLIGFCYFIMKKKFSKEMIRPMVLLFVLGALQGAIGWIMVKSGLVPEQYFVGHIELTTHFIAALILLSYTLWFALKLMVPNKRIINDSTTRNWIIMLLVMVFIQLVFGGFMAGMKAAATAPTWPDINGYLIPTSIGELSPAWKNVWMNKITVHFIHRGLAYLIFIVNVVLFFKTSRLASHAAYNKLRYTFAGIVKIQVILGICTVLVSTSPNTFVIYGVLHQFTAMLLVMCLVTMKFYVRKSIQA